MFAPEMPLSLAGRKNKGRGRQSASNMARCLIGSRKWPRLKSSSLRLDNRGGGLFEGLADQEADAFEIGCARGLRGSRREREDRRKADRQFQIYGGLRPLLGETSYGNVALSCSGEIMPGRADYLVVDAVSRNRSARPPFPPVIAG